MLIGGVSDGSYLRGTQIAALEIDPALEVLRSELYLDKARVAADDFAPFELAWDTRAFDDGAHTLTARAYLTSGEHVDGITEIWIDNTPPAVDRIQSTAVGGQPFLLDVSDNLKVAQVEITRDVPGELPIIVTKAPFAFTWAWGCGTSTLHVRVIDAAGSDASATGTVTSIDIADRDCDGFRTKAEGGPDCDDDNATAHPGASEPPEGFDLDCDGRVASLDGFDSDHDGVPSVSDGGNDCNDTDPAIHGSYYNFAHAAVRVGDVPVTWNPGEAALVSGGASWALYLNRGGVIQQYAPDFNNNIVVRQVATGANPSSLSVQSGRVAYGRGNDVVILEQAAESWREHAVIHAAGPVGKLVTDRTTEVEIAAFQTGTDTWFASSPDGSTWTTEYIADLREPLVENPSGYGSLTYAAFSFRTSQASWSYAHSRRGEPFRATRIGPAGHVALAMTSGLGPSLALVAVDDGAGSAIYRDGWPEPVLRTSRRITAMAASYPSVFVQFEGSGLEVFVVTRGITALRRIQIIPDIGPFDAVNYSSVAGAGLVHYLTIGSVSSATDPIDDGVDRDCNEQD